MVGQADLEGAASLAAGQLGLEGPLVAAVRRARARAPQPGQEGPRVVEVAEVSAGPGGLGREGREGWRVAFAEARPGAGQALGDLARALVEQERGLGLELAQVEAAQRPGAFAERERGDPGLALGAEARALGGAGQESAEGVYEVQSWAPDSAARKRPWSRSSCA